MKGFDPKFKDLPDYIISITKEIWEGREISSLHKYYDKDIIVRSPSSVVVGNQKVIDATISTLAEFPDRTLYGEDVIWCGDPEKGMLSSHRIHSTVTHTKKGIYGAPTGRKLNYRIIADCHAKNNKVDDEWLIRDQGAILKQLDLDPKEFARELISKEGGPENCVKPYTYENEIKGPYIGTGNDNHWGQLYSDILTRIMSADFSVIPKEYDRAVNLEYAGGISDISYKGADNFWMGLRSSFPSAEFKICHQIGRLDEKMPPRAAVRWILNGKHDGWGTFGEPTGASVFILGASHSEFGPHGLRREYCLFDYVSIWKQILIHTGAVY